MSREIHYLWDPAKDLANQAKHGVGFATAVQALLDPIALSAPDPHPDDDRWRTLGCPDPGLPFLLFVVHTDSIELNGGLYARIISARPATRHERRDYEQG